MERWRKGAMAFSPMTHNRKVLQNMPLGRIPLNRKAVDRMPLGTLSRIVLRRMALR
jgi:hypothetical protein